MKINALILSILTISLTACAKQNTEEALPTGASEVTVIETVNVIPEKILPTADNVQTSLDWNGTYKGTMPCANCEGIETKLELNKNETYKLYRKYIGLKDIQQEELEEGSFTFDTKKPSIIFLGSPSNRKVFLGENYAEFLDEDGDKITGPLAEMNKLKKD